MYLVIDLKKKKQLHISDEEATHNEDVYLASHDGVLLFTKQLEDLTFYCDELKSELEAERERSGECQAEIQACRARIHALEEQQQRRAEDELPPTQGETAARYLWLNMVCFFFY